MNNIPSKNRVFSFLILFLSISNINAQESYTLKQCIDSAFKNNLRIRQQHITERGYRLDIKKAENARLPAISAFTSGNANWGRGIDPFTNTYANQQFNTYNGGINLDMNLFNGFFHINNIKLQKQNLESNKSEFQKLKNDITIDLTMRYTNILYLQEMIKNIRVQIKNSQTNLDFTQKRIDAGVLAKREIYKAIAQKENEELNLIRAENDLQTNMVELKQLMGMEVSSEIKIQDLNSEPIPKENKSTFLTKAMNYAPSLKLQKINLEKSDLSLDIAKSGFYPSISLGGQLGSTYSTFNRFFDFGQQIDNNFAYGLNVNARIPIFSRFDTRNRVQEAKYNIQSAKNQLDIEKQNLYKVLNKAHLDLMTSQKKYKVSTSSLESNQINYDTEKLKYEAGRITLQELNIAKTNLFSSVSNNTKDKYEYIFNSLVYKIYEGEFK